jgi:hypothetical protein
MGFSLGLGNSQYGAGRRTLAVDQSNQICIRTVFRIYFRKSMEFTTMPATRRKNSLSAYRRRLKRQGVIRLELNVRKADASLLRGVVKALTDPQREAEARALLRERFGAGEAAGFKEFLASAPLEGIDLERRRDLGRDVEL